MTTRPLTVRPRLAALAAAMAAFAALAVSAPPAEAQKRRPSEPQQSGETVVGRITPRQMAAVLRNRGHEVEIVTDNDNRTRLRTRIASRRVTVFFYACNDEGCQSIQYRAIFEKNERFTLAFVNAWNYEKRFAKTYLDSDNDLVLEWDVDFDGGVTVGFISESVATFQTMINAFDRFTPRAGTGGSSGASRQAPAPAPGPGPADPAPASGGKEGAPGERRT